MWANAQRDGRPAKYRWRPVLSVAKFGSRPLLECRAVTLPIGERKTWRMQSEFCTWQNSVMGNSRRKCIYNLPAQVSAKHHAKFGWLPLRDIAAVTKPRRESRWNYLGCPKQTDRSQPLVGQFTILWGHVEEMLLLNKYFSDSRYMP